MRRHILSIMQLITLSSNCLVLLLQSETMYCMSDTCHLRHFLFSYPLLVPLYYLGVSKHSIMSVSVCSGLLLILQNLPCYSKWISSMAVRKYRPNSMGKKFQNSIQIEGYQMQNYSQSPLRYNKGNTESK